MDKQFPASEPVELYVQLGSGAIRAEAAETDECRVQVKGPRADDFTVEQRGSHVVVVPPKDRLGIFGSHEAHEVIVAMPARSALVCKSGSALVEGTGALGMVRVKTGSGDVDLERSTGPVAVDSGSGAITCGEVEGEVRIRSGSGDVEVGKGAGNTAVSTGSGDIVLGRIEAKAVLKTGSGDIAVHRGADSLSADSGSGSITLANFGNGDVQARTATGDIRITVPPGTPVWTDVSSKTGRIASNLASVGKPAEGQDHVRLRLRTTTGDILLGPA